MLILLIIPWFCILFLNLEHTGNIESDMNIAIQPPSACMAQECIFLHAHRIGEYDLEYMPSGFYVYSQCQGIVYGK